MFIALTFFQCPRTFDFQAAPANEGQCAERHVYDSSECGLCYSEAAIQNCSKEEDGKRKYDTSLCVNVRN